MKVSMNQVVISESVCYMIKVNGIPVLKTSKQPEAMKAFNMIQKGTFLQAVRLLWKRAKNGGYKSTAKLHAEVILKFKCAMKGVMFNRYSFEGWTPFYTTQLKSCRV